MLFHDRAEAGRALAERLAAYAGRADVLVLALPRGGVVVGHEVSQRLGLPLDVHVVRKLGFPGHPELAIGAIASGGVRVVSRDVTRRLGVADDEIEAIAAEEQRELERREHSYRGERPPPDVRGRTVILVDDGLATGSTMRAAVASLRQRGPARIVVAVPVGSPEACAEFREEADEVVCARQPDPFMAVGLWYADFSQTTDEEVRQLLGAAAPGPARPRTGT
jgi:predicted phosphoribosyltransferase